LPASTSSTDAKSGSATEVDVVVATVVVTAVEPASSPVSSPVSSPSVSSGTVRTRQESGRSSIERTPRTS